MVLRTNGLVQLCPRQRAHVPHPRPSGGRRCRERSERRLYCLRVLGIEHGADDAQRNVRVARMPLGDRLSLPEHIDQSRQREVLKQLDAYVIP